ncbi:efflux RND transporter periplasmic adaptor subunit [Sphingomonas naphthae]|uniref:Efflux RND transporter periplasmic adaptor subunit n=1 Tax=Sphingomonas naphthae TaxID=1813468 RepID=A0ABY7TKM1_9SPHN|nr:efflux RND transporter periplasmic adaptor subunit [Sphingomonas naphthae]WCT72824.1 efflux RND transporter periplasmic adaptor subunit [Sphingomonas naphthae]
MSQSHIAPPLPSVPALSPDRQRRYLMMGGGGLVAVLLAAAGISHVTAPAPAAEQAPTDGRFHPTKDQLSGLGLLAVGSGHAIDTLTATGMISVDEDHSTPVLLPFSGQVTQVLVEAGETVSAGQPLMKVATSEFVDARNGLFAAAAQRASAVSALSIAQETARRQEAIFRTAGGAEKDYRQAQNELIAAQSAARSADAGLGAARDRLSILGKSPREIAALERSNEVEGIRAETTLHAPVGGIVAARAVAPGQYVGAGGDKPVMVIADPRRVWLVAQLAESDASAVKLGDMVDVTTPALPGRVFHATIDNVAAQLDPVSHRLPVRATVANADGALKPQMFASFSIHTRSEAGAMLVPGSAVIREGDAARVWVMNRDGSLSGRPVTVAEGGDGKVRILSGLHVGERIVTSGAIFVNEAGIDG